MMDNKKKLFVSSLIAAASFGFVAFQLLGQGAAAPNDSGKLGHDSKPVAKQSVEARSTLWENDPFFDWEPAKADPKIRSAVNNASATAPQIHLSPMPPSGEIIALPGAMSNSSGPVERLPRLNPKPLNVPPSGEEPLQSADDLDHSALAQHDPAAAGANVVPTKPLAGDVQNDPNRLKGLLVLRGIISFNATKAYLEYEGKVAKAMDVGAEIAPGLVIQQISTRSILVTHKGTQIRLKVGQEYKLK